MKNRNLRILLMGGYFDLATPYYKGCYEMHHVKAFAQEWSERDERHRR
jgi:hypothetical protein